MILPLARILLPLPKNVCYKIDWENPHSFRPKPLSVRRPKCVTLGIFLKEISKILVKRSSLELLVVLLMNTYFISGIRDMLRNCFKLKELIKRPPPLMGLKHTAALQMT